MHRFGYGVLAGGLLSLFLPLLPAFFTIIFAWLVIQLIYWRCWLLLGICSFFGHWHWQLERYYDAQQQLLSASGSYIAVEILRVDSTTEGSHLQLKLLQPSLNRYQVGVYWQQAPPLLPGEQWLLALNLKPPSGYLNPWSPQPQLSALVKKQLGQGYVARNTPAIKVGASQSSRAALLARLEQHISELDNAVLIRALLSGERDFDATMWQGLRNSGLGHLLVISGLHISLVYGWSYLLFKQLLRHLNPKVEERLALLLAFLPALGYAWLAGFAIPTLRAALALFLFMIGRALLRPANPSGYWWLLIGTLLLLQPFWVLSYSFWLSVLAVALILLVIRFLGTAPVGFWLRLKYFLVFQLILSGLMTMITLAFFSGLSPLALLSNLLFIPWCTLLAIPLLLFTLACFLLGLPITALLWRLCDGILSPLQFWLQLSAEQNWWWSHPELPMAAAILMIVTCAVLLLLRGSKVWWGVWLATMTLALMPTGSRQPQLTLLDSGQRTVLLVRKPNANLLYLDLPGVQSDMAIQQFVLPLLSYYRLKQLDIIVVPALHPDLQAALTPVLARYPHATIYAANAAAGVKSCQRLSLDYPTWIQHWPLPADDPCVLSLRLNSWQLMLPGRLSVKSEQQLVLRYPDLNADIYLLADYGRDSANSLTFLQQLAPVQIILSASRGNHYSYPVQAVRPRLSLLNLPLYHSGNEGALQLVLQPEQLLITTERQQRWPRWIENPTQ